MPIDERSDGDGVERRRRDGDGQPTYGVRPRHERRHRAERAEEDDRARRPSTVRSRAACGKPAANGSSSTAPIHIGHAVSSRLS